MGSLEGVVEAVETCGSRCYLGEGGCAEQVRATDVAYLAVEGGRKADVSSNAKACAEGACEVVVVSMQAVAVGFRGVVAVIAGMVEVGSEGEAPAVELLREAVDQAALLREA